MLIVTYTLQCPFDQYLIIINNVLTNNKKTNIVEPKPKYVRTYQTILFYSKQI